MLGRPQILPPVINSVMRALTCRMGFILSLDISVNIMLCCGAELPANAQLVISNGLFTHHKRLDRIIAAMGRVTDSSFHRH